MATDGKSAVEHSCASEVLGDRIYLAVRRCTPMPGSGVVAVRGFACAPGPRYGSRTRNGRDGRPPTQTPLAIPSLGRALTWRPLEDAMDPWKLVCHHTYAGTPGVVYDLSPDHQNHAVAVDIDDADFLRDGAQVGSGSVRLRTRDARIRIPENPSWRPLDALRGEVTVLLETPQSGHAAVSRLVDADSFHL